jgi:hypothetical protein
MAGHQREARLRPNDPAIHENSEGREQSRPFFYRHCEERSDEAIQLPLGGQKSWIASLRSQ